MALRQAGRQTVLIAEQPFDYTELDTAAAVVAVDLPPGAIVTGGHINVNTAFDSTTNTVSIGDTGSATRYGATVDLKTLGATALTGVPFYNSTGLAVQLTYAETGAATTAGAGTLVVEYVIEGRANEAQ